MLIRGLSKADSAIISNPNRCTINRALSIANKSNDHRVALLNYFNLMGQKNSQGTIGHGMAMDYLNNLLSESGEFGSNTIVGTVDAPSVQLDEDETACNLLISFYSALGWNKNDYLNPRKVRTTQAIYNQLLEMMLERHQNAEQIGMLMVNNGPGVDEIIPHGKVVLLEGWVMEPTEMKGTLYKVEAGVLLPSDHPEFGSYNHVYTRDHGFYDEDARVFSTYAEAKAWGDSYIESGANMTYAVITSDTYSVDGTDAQLIAELLSSEACPDSSWNFGHAEKDIIYFAHKENGGIVVHSPGLCKGTDNC